MLSILASACADGQPVHLILKRLRDQAPLVLDMCPYDAMADRRPYQKLSPRVSEATW